MSDDAPPPERSSARDGDSARAATPAAPAAATWLRWAIVVMGVLVLGALAWTWTADDDVAPTAEDPAGDVQGEVVEVPPVPTMFLVIPALDDRFTSEPCTVISGGGIYSVRAAVAVAENVVPTGVRLAMGDISQAPGPIGRATTEFYVGNVLSEARIDVLAAGEGELQHGTSFVREILATSASVPILCANAVDSGGYPMLKGWSLLEAGNRSVLVVAVAGESVGLELAVRGSDVQIGPTVAAAREALDEGVARGTEIGKPPHTRVLLVHGTIGEAEKVVREVPGYDVCVAADGPILPELEPRDVDGVPVLYGGRGARFLWRFVEVDGMERELAMSRLGDRLIAMGCDYADRMLALRQLIRRGLMPGLAEQDERPPHPDGDVVGSAICADCHPDQHAEHGLSGHAAAPAGFLESDYSGSTGCISCHLTFPLHRGGWLPGDDRGTAEIGCESCHGPGGDHVDRPEPGYGDVELARCYDCHLPDRSPGFNAAEWWERAGHGALPPPPRDDGGDGDEGSDGADGGGDEDR